MNELLMVFGTRPEAIKMALLVHEIESHPDDFSIGLRHGPAQLNARTSTVAA